MRHLYRAVGIPKLTYALEDWYDPPTKVPGKRNTAGSVAALKIMARVQRLASIAITGAIKSTATDVLDAHTDLLPMETLLKSICKRSYIRLCTLPASHPLSPLVTNGYRHRNRTCHPYPIQALAKTFNINPSTVEKIGINKRLPKYRPVYESSIAASRKDSIAKEAVDDTPIRSSPMAHQ